MRPRRHARALLCAAALVLAATGCASGVASTEAPAALTAPIPEGRYTGIITGRDLATAATVATMGADLTIAPDGRWTMRTDSGVASGRVVRATPDRVVLEGRFADGAAAWYDFAREDGDDFLVGPGPSVFAGHTVWAGFQLRRAGPPLRVDRPN